MGDENRLVKGVKGEQGEAERERKEKHQPQQAPPQLSDGGSVDCT